MSLREKAVSGTKWVFIQQLSVQAIHFGVQILLARLLVPEMFGLIAMINVLIALGVILMDSGMTSSLIRTKDPDQLDYSTVFITNLIFSVILFSINYCIAPYIAKFYEQVVLVDIIRIFGLVFILNAFSAVHIAKLTKEMNFKAQLKLQLPATILSGILSIYLAFKGFGVWSLVWLNISRTFLVAIQAWLFLKWKPSLTISLDRLKNHFNFGYKLTLSAILDTIYNDAYRIIFGKFFTPATAGFYHQAENLRLFPIHQISTVMNKVTYPLFSEIKTDAELKKAYKVIMKLVLTVVIPMMLSLILIAEEGFELVFGTQWLPAAVFFKILALASIVRPISAYNLNILKVKGRSDIFLKLELVKKSLGVIFILIGLAYGSVGLVIASTIFFYITVLIDMKYSGALISYNMTEQIKDISHLFLLGALSYSIIYYIKLNTEYLFSYNLLKILIYSILLTFIYLVSLMFVDREIRKNFKSILRAI